MLSLIDFLVQTSIVEPTVVWLLFQSQKIGLNSKLDACAICICGKVNNAVHSHLVSIYSMLCDKAFIPKCSINYQGCH